MPTIHLTTFIQAPAQRVFDLSRSIDFHLATQQHAGEQAVDGRTSGLIQLNETVTWQARHWLKTRRLTVKITAMQSPDFFEDSMLQGDFSSFVHKHYFKRAANGTIMIDLLTYQAPYGWLGKVIERFVLTRYLRRLLTKRNHVLKEYAESERWKTILKSTVKSEH